MDFEPSTEPIKANSSEARICRAEGSFLSKQALSSHLKIVGYPENSINSLNKCGDPLKEGLKMCSCGSEIVIFKHKCNLRVCPSCSNRRKGRIRNQYQKLLCNLPHNSYVGLKLLTISPLNYTEDFEYYKFERIKRYSKKSEKPYYVNGEKIKIKGLEAGLYHIRDSFNNLLRNNYIKLRVFGGLYVIEVKNIGKGWNIHIHSIVYSRRMDNRLRGVCLDCKQNLIKYNHSNNNYYCGSRKCNSSNVCDIKKPKLSRIVERVFKRQTNTHISDKFKDKNTGEIYRTRENPKYCLNYMLKYVSSNKDDFDLILDKAFYVLYTKGHRLITTFGRLYNCSVRSLVVYKCHSCNSNVNFSTDIQVITEFRNQQEVRPPDANERL